MSKHSLAAFGLVAWLAVGLLAAAAVASDAIEPEATAPAVSPAFVAGAALAPGLPPAPPPGVVPLPVEWRRLDYGARNLAGTFEATLSLDPMPGGAPEGAWATELTTSMESFWLRDQRTRVRAWFDGASGAVARFTKLSLGPKPDLKEYEFAPNGVTRVRTEPQRGERDYAPERWSQVVETFHAVRAEDHGCQVMTEPSALLAVVTQRAGDAIRDPKACVFYGKTLYRLRVEWGGRTQARVEYRLRGPEGAQWRRDRIESDRFEVVATPIAGELDETEEAFTLHVDARSRVPWKVVSPTGGLEFSVQLREVVVAPTPALSETATLGDLEDAS